jgi:hypothetical protein
MSNTHTKTEASAVKATRKSNKIANLPYEIRLGFGYLVKYGTECKLDIARNVISKCPEEDALKVIASIEAAREFFWQNCA